MSTLADIEEHYHQLSLKFKDFIHKIGEEGHETKEAYEVLRASVVEDRKLTVEEKLQVGEQLKDVLKTVGLIGIAALPGGSLFFVVSTYLKINKYVMPSAFNEVKNN